jgi:hypothetical protein
MQKHPLQMRPRHFAPALFVAFFLAASAGAMVWGTARIALAGVAGVYAIANVAASLAAPSGDRGVRLRLPICFATLHFSYGLGFLWGLIRFAGRWGDRGPALSKMANAPSGRA